MNWIIILSITTALMTIFCIRQWRGKVSIEKETEFKRAYLQEELNRIQGYKDMADLSDTYCYISAYLIYTISNLDSAIILPPISEFDQKYKELKIKDYEKRCNSGITNSTPIEEIAIHTRRTKTLVQNLRDSKWYSEVPKLFETTFNELQEKYKKI